SSFFVALPVASLALPASSSAAFFALSAIPTVNPFVAETLEIREAHTLAPGPRFATSSLGPLGKGPWEGYIPAPEPRNYPPRSAENGLILRFPPGNRHKTVLEQREEPQRRSRGQKTGTRRRPPGPSVRDRLVRRLLGLLQGLFNRDPALEHLRE